jgi:hypothetical protein
MGKLEAVLFFDELGLIFCRQFALGICIVRQSDSYVII